MTKYLLALETATEKGSLGVFTFQQGELKTLSLKKWSCKTKGKNKNPSHSERLPLAIQEALNEAKIQSQNLDVLAVDAGPGRFTGVRTGVNVIKTLSFILKKPIYPLNSLQITAEQFSPSLKPVTVVFNAFKNSVYYGEFFKGQALVEPCVMSFSQWKKKSLSSCVGDIGLFHNLPESVSFTLAYPKAEDLARIFFNQNQKEKLLNWRELEPLYLRSV